MADSQLEVPRIPNELFADERATIIYASLFLKVVGGITPKWLLNANNLDAETLLSPADAEGSEYTYQSCGFTSTLPDDVVFCSECGEVIAGRATVFAEDEEDTAGILLVPPQSRKHSLFLFVSVLHSFCVFNLSH